MESHKIIFMVLGDPDVLAVHGDEESHEEASERVSLVSGKLGPEAFKGPLLTHRKAITTGWKSVGRVSRDNPKARESILEEELAENVSLSLNKSLCLNREPKVKGLPNQANDCKSRRNGCKPINS